MGEDFQQPTPININYCFICKKEKHCHNIQHKIIIQNTQNVQRKLRFLKFALFLHIVPER